jgi:hypothetical protein
MELSAECGMRCYMRSVALAVAIVLVVGSVAQAQIRYLSDTRSVSAVVRLDYIPGGQAIFCPCPPEYQGVDFLPLVAGPLGTYRVFADASQRRFGNPEGWIEEDRQESAATGDTFSAAADAMIFREFGGGTRGGAGHAWQESTLSSNRITGSGGIFGMDARIVDGRDWYTREGRAVATSLFDVTFRLDQPAQLAVAIEANIIPAPHAACEFGRPEWCRENQHAGETSYVLTGPGIDYQGTVQTRWDFQVPPATFGASEIPTASMLAETIEAPPGEYRVRLLAEGRGEHEYDTSSATHYPPYNRNMEPDRTWFVDIQAMAIPEPSTWLVAAVGLIGLFLFRRHRCK